MTLLIRGTRAALSFVVVLATLIMVGCSGLTSAGLPTSATHSTSGGANSSNGSDNVSLQVTLSSTSVNFGSVIVGSTNTREVQITNTGAAKISITQNAASGPGFSANGIGFGLILNPAQAATLAISFNPVSAGQVAGTVLLISDAWSTPVNIALSGTGVDPVAHSAYLAWQASASVAVGYNVYRGTGSGGPYTKLNPSPLANSSYTDQTVASGKIYFYVVTAVDLLGIESDPSNQVSARIP